jgi:hypothetical protein
LTFEELLRERAVDADPLALTLTRSWAVAFSTPFSGRTETGKLCLPRTDSCTVPVCFLYGPVWFVSLRFFADGGAGAPTRLP